MSAETTTALGEERDRVARLVSERLEVHDESRQAALERLYEICNRLRKHIDDVESSIISDLEKKFTAEDARLQASLNGLRADTATDDNKVLKSIQKAKTELLVMQSYKVVGGGECVPKKKKTKTEEGQKTETDLFPFCELKVERSAFTRIVELKKPTNLRVISVTGGKISVRFAHFTRDELKILSKYNVEDPVKYLCSLNEKSEGGEGVKVYPLKKNYPTFESIPKTLNPGNTYELRVRAELDGKESEWSDVVEFTPTYLDCYAWKECPGNVDMKRSYRLDENSHRIATRSGEEFCTVIGNAPLVHDKKTIWNVKILQSHNNGDGIFIGVAPSDINQDSYNNFNTCGWYFNCYRSSLFSGPPHKYWDKKYGRRNELGKYVETGDKIGVVMDTANGELSFTLNTEARGIAFVGIPLDRPLVPCVILGGHEGDSVELII